MQKPPKKAKNKINQVRFSAQAARKFRFFVKVYRLFLFL